jgi:hypothetical protein
MLIPIILTEVRQAYLIHLDPIRLLATIYVASHYETHGDPTSIEELSHSDMITIDNAFDVDPQCNNKSVILQISDFVFDLIEKLELEDYRAS